jgi:cysteine desulfurase / selenocysteine lyase
VSNVLGTVLPIEELARAAHDAGATVLLDAAQSAPHRPLDVDRLGVDALAFSGHKMLGPTGIGVLWGRRSFLDELPPYQGGGEMIREVHLDRVTFQDPPARFEAGTPNISGAIGLAAAMRYLTAIGWEEIADHEHGLTRHALDGFRNRFGDRVRVYGPPAGPDRDAIFSFSLRGTHPHDVAQILDSRGIAIRSGHHCAQPLMERFGVPALSRASAYLYTKTEELDAMFDALDDVESLLLRPGEVAAPTAPG